MDIILLGAPGAGKGTQAEKLRQYLNVPSISSGDLLRSAAKAGTPLGNEAKGYMDRGELVPDKVTIGLVRERLEQPDCAQGVILDGFPRTVAQAEVLDDILKAMGRQIDAVLHIRVAEAELLTRLTGRWTCKSCGAIYHEVHNPEKVKGVCDVCGGPLYQRDDDTRETQLNRIQVFRDQTAPLIDYYEGKGLLIEIDGENDVDQVRVDLQRVVDELR